MRSLVVAAGLAAFLCATAAAQVVDRVACGSEMTAELAIELQLLFDQGIYDDPPPEGIQWEIPVTMHVVRQGNGNGGATPGHVDQALADLNIFFAGANMTFCQMTPTHFIDSCQFYFGIDTGDEIVELRSTNNVPNTLNIYTTEFLAIEGYPDGICGI